MEKTFREFAKGITFSIIKMFNRFNGSNKTITGRRERLTERIKGKTKGNIREEKKRSVGFQFWTIECQD